MENQETNNIPVKIIGGGPLIITGTSEITHADGTVEIKENRASFCRCGLAKNKPFCDGSHKGVEWDK